MPRRIFINLMLGAAFVAGCASELDTIKTRDGVRYGVTDGVFRGRWWSYYERGSSYLSGQFHGEAEKDFQTALKGRASDTWRARTYGLHFVEYFPNRELGVVYFQQGKLAEAEAQLTKALAMVDTERGHYYLDAARRARIAQGEVADADAPAIRTDLAPAKIIAERELPVEVAVKDDNGVASVTVNEKPVAQRGSRPEVAAKEKVLLAEGKQEITVKARDLADKETVQKVEVTVDMTGPTLGIFNPIEPTVTPDNRILLEGTSVDKNGVTRVMLDKRMLAEDAKGTPKLAFNAELPLSPGENAFVLAARDIAGNETRSAIRVFRGDPKSATAQLWLRKQRLEAGLVFASSDPASMLVTAQAEVPAGGEIRLKSPQSEHPYRHNRSLTVSGEVLATSPVQSLAINGQPVEELAGAPRESFNRRLPIDEAALVDKGGRFAVAIRAEDKEGHVLEKSVEVEVKPVELDSKESRMPVAVLAFNGQGIDAATAARLRSETESALLNHRRFRTVDRTNLEAVLTEQQLASALADPNEAIRLGRLTNAQIFLVGDIFPRDAHGVEIKARVIHTETSEVMATLDAFAENAADTAALQQCADSLAAQLEQVFPRLSGEVTAVRGAADRQELLLNWTREDGLREGAYLLVVKESPAWVDESTGEVLAPAEYVPVGKARIEAPGDSGTRAHAVETTEGAVLEKGMPAVTM